MAYIGNTAASRFVSNRAASVYSGDGSTVAFTLEQVATQDEDILVSVDGVVQEPTVAYEVSSGTTLTFTAAPSTNSGNNIFVYYLASQTGTVGHPSNQALSATSGTFSTTLAVTGASTLSSSLAMTSDDPTITMTDSSGTNDIVKLQSTSGALIITARDGNANGEIIFKGDTGSAVTEHMRINNAGIITKPLQPAFYAHNNGTDNITNIAINANRAVPFSTELFDNNGDFASNTFTAPVTGKYTLGVSLRLQHIDSAANYYIVSIVISNLSAHFIFDPDYGQDNTHHSVRFSTLTHMDANDTASVTINQNAGTAQTDIQGDGSYTYFFGHLEA